MPRTTWQPHNLLIFFVFIVAGFFILQPAAFLLFGSFWSAPPGRPGYITTSNYAEVLRDPFLGRVLFNTFVFAAGASLIAIALGSTLAFLATRTDVPFKKAIIYSPILTFAMPSSVEGMGWTFLLSPRTGLVNVAFMRLTGIEEPLVNLYTLAGMTFVMGINLLPVAFLMTAPAFTLFDRSLEEMGRASGGGLLQVYRRIILPLVLPSIASAFIYCFIVAIEAFDTPAIVGIPAGVYVLTTTIYTQMVSEVPPRYGTATAYSAILLALSLILITLYNRFAKSADRYATLTGRSGSPAVINLGKYKPLAAVLVLGYLLIHPIPLMATLAIASVQRFWNPDRLLTNITLDNYEKFFSYPVTGTAFINSIIVSASSTALAVAVGFLAAYFSIRRKLTGGQTFTTILSIPLAVPPLVLAVGVFWSVLYVDIGLYGTVGALVYAYSLRYTPLVLRFLSGPMLQIHRELEDSAVVCGGGRLRTITNIILPLLRGAASTAALYVFVRTITDLGIAVLLVTHQSTVLSTTLFALWNTGEKLTVVAGGLVYTVVLLCFLLAAHRLGFRVLQPTTR
ncbi:MAG: iron ABC transporter permease [Candidatus Caldarchaeum sp.]|nr:iron ABC transporter permease [Candidatus Caldarchaeum sp.]